MRIVGLTGGIGSGKTTVAKEFQSFGVPIYIADDEAKKLINSSEEIKQQLIALFGPEAYDSGTLNRSFIADTIFKNKRYLKKMNAIVHPKVGVHFKEWVAKQNAIYVIKEAAIIFENNTYNQFDYIITVIAPKDLRMARLLKREPTTVEKIEAVMNNQWSDEEKVTRSHFVIENTSLADMKSQVVKIHHKILKDINTSKF